MDEPEPNARDKAIAILRESVGECVRHLSCNSEPQRIAREALSDCFGSEEAQDIAFHMTDWAEDAAFVAAFLLYPERFTPEEVRDGILDFLVHAPNHVAAAAKLHDFPIQDIFGVGALDGV